MANVFTRTNKKVSKPKRNMFDLSRQNNLTMQMGYLYPVSVDEVLPGDSLRIQPTFGLRFMPLTFPVQTRMRANLHFFYVRTRNLWKDWPDFIGKTKEGLVPPYHNTASGEVFNNICKTGSLGDYLGVPTTIASDTMDVTDYVPGASVGITASGRSYFGYPVLPFYGVANVSTTQVSYADLMASSGFDITKVTLSSGSVYYDGKPVTYVPFPISPISHYVVPLAYLTGGAAPQVHFTGPAVSVINFSSPISLSSAPEEAPVQLFNVVANGSGSSSGVFGALIFHGVSGNYYVFSSNSAYKPVGSVNYFDMGSLSGSVPQSGVSSVSTVASVPLSSPFFSDSFDAVIILQQTFGSVTSTSLSSSSSPFWPSSYGSDNTPYIQNNINIDSVRNQNSLFSTFFATPTGYMSFPKPYWSYSGNRGYIRDISPDNSPYYSSNTAEQSNQLKLSALPARAYESIYNSFYRDDTNNPYVLDGVVEYNKWIPSDEGGMDNNVYTLHRRNWEADFLTTAKPSPQQGEAPLVGLTATGMMTFQDDDGNTYRAQAVFAEDGETIQSFKVLDEGMPKGTLRSLVDYATQGISINDLRNVNSLQRWLEKNIRRGFTYKDQIMSHYGVDVSYNILNMPEFIGGCSQDVSVNQINQMVERSNSGSFSDALGSYAGQAYCIGSGRPITHYFDEHGFVIGILSITPVPNYSQLLPKYFLKTDALDYFFPEFGHIGYQPIYNREVSPVQVFANHLAGVSGSDADMLGVFGYQRAWYEYLARVDEVHGLFRTNMRNFLVNRYFGSVPTLSPDFLLVDPGQVNDIFSVTDTTDKILGQVYLDVKAKRPIPMYGIPRLE